MADPRIVRLVQMIPLFRDLSEEQAELVANILRYQEVRPGTVIYRQGDLFNAMIIFVEGGGRLLLVGEDGIERSVGDVEPGEIIGESSLFIEDERDVTLLVTRPSKIFVITKNDLDRLRGAHPSLDKKLNIREDIRKRLGMRLFKWLRPGESAVIYKRRHIWAFIKRLFVAVVILLILGGISAGIMLSIALPVWLQVVLFVIPLAITALVGTFYYLDWRNDYLVVTNQRVVREENALGVFGEMAVSQVSIRNVQNVNFEQSSPLARYFGFGDLVIATAGAEGSIVFGPVSDPEEVQNIIFKLRDRYKAKQMAEYRNSIRAEIARRLGLESLDARLDLFGSGDGGNDEAVAVAVAEEPTLPEKPSSFSFKFFGELIAHWLRSLADHFNPTIRMEEGEIVTYRKHWIVLIGSIATPTLIGCLILFVVPIMRYEEFWPLDSRVPWGWVIVGMLGLLALDMFWWVVRFDDWRNDLYQVTPTSVIAEKRGWLGIEGYRKVAGLDQIQSVDVRVKGFKQRLFNYGQVVIHTAGQEGALVFDTVFKPTLVAEDVDRRRRAFAMRKEEREEKEQHELLAEWFAIYHQATHPDAFAAVESPYRRVYKAPPEIQAVFAGQQDTRVVRRGEMSEETRISSDTAASDLQVTDEDSSDETVISDSGGVQGKEGESEQSADDRSGADEPGHGLDGQPLVGLVPQ